MCIVLSPIFELSGLHPLTDVGLGWGEVGMCGCAWLVGLVVGYLLFWFVLLVCLFLFVFALLVGWLVFGLLCSQVVCLVGWFVGLVLWSWIDGNT